MGYASYLEDVIDRLTDDLNALRSSIGGTGKKKRSDRQDRQHAIALLRMCEKALGELTKNLDLVTDPALDWPAANEALQKELTQSGDRIKELEGTLEERDMVIKRLRAEVVRLQNEKERA